MSKEYTYCPNCGNNLLRVTMTTTGNVLFPGDGSDDPQTQDIEPHGDYGPESSCSCEKCGTDGTLAEFTHSHGVAVVPPASVTLRPHGANPWTVAVHTFKSTAEVREAVLLLARESCWFEVTPLPCDYYEVCVKDDRAPTLQDIVRGLTQ